MAPACGLAQVIHRNTAGALQRLIPWQRSSFSFLKNILMTHRSPTKCYKIGGLGSSFCHPINRRFFRLTVPPAPLTVPVDREFCKLAIANKPTQTSQNEQAKQNQYGCKRNLNVK